MFDAVIVLQCRETMLSLELLKWATDRNVCRENYVWYRNSPGRISCLVLDRYVSFQKLLERE